MAESIRTALAPNAPASKRSKLLQRALSEPIEKEEEVTGLPVPKVAPGYSAIFLTDEQLDKADEASRLGPWDSLADFCRDAILSKADEIIAAEGRRRGGATGRPANILPFVITRHGSVAAGGKSSADVEETEIPVGKQYKSDHYALRVLGRSMEPTIPDGSIIIVKAFKDQGFPRRGSIVVYNDGYGTTLKVFDYEKAKGDEEHARLGKIPVLKSINPEFPDVEPLEGGRIDAVFVEVLDQQ